MRAKLRALPVIWWVLFAGCIWTPALCAILSLRDGSLGYAAVFAGIALFWVGMFVVYVKLREVGR